MDLPIDSLVRPIKDSDDVLAFQFPFALEAKALPDGAAGNIVSELEDGDLIIEGWAADFDGVDRQGENFTDGAFQRGIKAFLSGSAPLCFHHKHDQVLGQVLDLEEVEGKGLRMRARVDGAIKNHPVLGTIYSQIKRGTFRNLSVGGFFKRQLTAAGYRIADMDFTEVSITGVPIHNKTSFAVVAGKALESPAEVAESSEVDTAAFDGVLDQLSSTLDSIAKRYPEGKSVKGDPQDLYFLASLLRLEQITNSLTAKKESDYGSASDDRVDALIVRVKNYLDGIAREVHTLAGELGPLPSVAIND
jgi:HK97 family phage prohead protease